MAQVKGGDIGIVTDKQSIFYGYQVEVEHNCFEECEAGAGCTDHFFPLEGTVIEPGGERHEGVLFAKEGDISDLSAS
ncbi:MAG: hypothetical protein J2P36_05000 [Ktedonobacteraceae bacterium]|nr:hypothetical protein [Ktedonobacteraceae bacterium]